MTPNHDPQSASAPSAASLAPATGSEPRTCIDCGDVIKPDYPWPVCDRCSFRHVSEDDDDCSVDGPVCGMCGDDGWIMLSDAGPSEWGEDCFCELDRAIECPECRDRRRFEAQQAKSPNAAVSDGGTPFAPRPGSESLKDQR